MNKDNLVFRPLTIMIDDESYFIPNQIYKFMRIDGNIAFGAILEGKIIGLIYGYTLCQLCNDKPQFFVYSVAIHSSFQNRGYGSRFFQYIVDYCQKNNYAEVFVPTDKGNARACKVYEKAGGKNDNDDEIIYVFKLIK